MKNYEKQFFPIYDVILEKVFIFTSSFIVKRYPKHFKKPIKYHFHKMVLSK